MNEEKNIMVQDYSNYDKLRQLEEEKKNQRRKIFDVEYERWQKYYQKKECYKTFL